MRALVIPVLLACGADADPERDAAAKSVTGDAEYGDAWADCYNPLADTAEECLVPCYGMHDEVLHCGGSNRGLGECINVCLGK